MSNAESAYRTPIRQNHPLMILKVELSRLVGTVLIIVGGNILDSSLPGLKIACIGFGLLFFILFGVFQNRDGLRGGLEHKLWRFGLSKIDKYNYDPVKDREFFS